MGVGEPVDVVMLVVVDNRGFDLEVEGVCKLLQLLEFIDLEVLAG